MFKQDTLIVVGAGASYEVGLPTGETLLKQIAESLSFKFDRRYGHLERGSREIVAAIEEIVEAFDPPIQSVASDALYSAARHISSASVQAISIDNILHAMQDSDISTIGKLGISEAILKAERDSTFFQFKEEHPNRHIDLKKFDKSWYSSFSKMLTQDVRRSDVANIFDGVEIVSFNYDRCIEHYLPYSLSSYFSGEPSEYYDIVKKLVIHRPFGKVGDLPWQGTEETRVDFGSYNHDDLLKAHRSILTFTESVTDTEAIDEAMIKAKRIIFLGFAYHKQNMNLLSAKRNSRQSALGTCLGLSASDVNVIKNELNVILRPANFIADSKIELADMTCAQLFKDYWRTLAR